MPKHNCPYCGETKTKTEFVDSDGKPKTTYVCMNAACFSDPFAGNKDKYPMLTAVQLCVGVIVTLLGIIVWLATK